MVSLVTDSIDNDELTNELIKVPSSPATATDGTTVPSISDLDFSEPLFDSLPDFDTLKDYWIYQSLGIEVGVDMVGDESGVEVNKEVSVGDKFVNESESLNLGVKAEAGQNGDFENEGDTGLEIDDVGVEVNGNEEALKGVESAVKIDFGGSGSLCHNIEVDMRKVSLDGQVDASVAYSGIDVKIEEEADSSSESDSSESSEASSSEDTSSSDDEDEDESAKRKAEFASQLEEGEIMVEDVEQMVAWSDDDEDVVKGPIRSKNEMTELPPVPKVDVTLNPNHQTFPVGVILSIVEKQIIVEGVDKHTPLNEGSILWITETREPLGLVDDIFGPVKNPYYSIRYNNEDEVPSGISIGTPVSFVPEFVNHVLNDATLYKKGYDASNEYDEELSEELEFSDDEKEAEYRRMMKLSKRGSNEEAGGKKKKDKRKNKNQESVWNNNLRAGPSPQSNSNEGDFFANNSSQHSSAPETPHIQRNHFPEGGPPFPFSNGMPAPFPQMNQTTNFNLGPNGVWPNGMPIQQQQQPMFFPNAFPNNGTQWMQQNNLVRNPFMSIPMAQGMPFLQQFGNNQMLPANLAFPGLQQMFMSGSGIFGQNNFNQGNGQFMATPVSGASLTNIPSTEQNGSKEQPPNTQGHTDGQQVFPNSPSIRGRNSNSQWRGCSGGRGGRFNKGRGFGGRGRGRHHGN